MAGVFMMTACLGFIVLGMISFPLERASVINETSTTKIPLYLPIVEESLDQYHWEAWPNHDASKKEGLVFCDKRGHKPPFAEGQTVIITYRVWPDCLELIAADCQRVARPFSDCIVRKEN